MRHPHEKSITRWLELWPDVLVFANKSRSELEHPTWREESSYVVVPSTHREVYLAWLDGELQLLDDKDAWGDFSPQLPPEFVRSANEYRRKPTVTYRQPIIPQDIGKMCEFSDCCNFSKKHLNTLNGYRNRRWLAGAGDVHWNFVRIIDDRPTEGEAE